MRGIVPWVAVMIVMVAAVLIAGCGGSDDGPSPQPNDGWTLPEAIALPSSRAPQPGSQSLQDALAQWADGDNVPSNPDQLQDQLNMWADAVDADENDAAAQVGLMMAILAMSSQNAAESLGYDLFAQQPINTFASFGAETGVSTQLLLEDTVATATTGVLPRLRGGPEGIHPAQAAPDQDLTPERLAQWQQAIEEHLLPAVQNSIAQMDMLYNGSDPDTVLITYTADGEIYTLHAADFQQIAAVMDLFYAMLLQLTAINSDYGSYNWGMDMVDRDVNGDGMLTLAEYVPLAPFLDINDMNWALAGGYLRSSVMRTISAIDAMPGDPNDLLVRSSASVDLADLRQTLENVDELLSGPVDVTVEGYTAQPLQVDWLGPTTENLQVNLIELWDDPPDSLRSLLPPLYIGVSYAHYDVYLDEELFDDLNLRLRSRDLIADEWTYSLAAPIGVPRGPAPHRLIIDASVTGTPAEFVFNGHWTEFTGYIGQTPIRGELTAPDNITYAFGTTWDDLPDPTFSGLFPNPAAMSALVTSGYDKVIIKYEDIEIPLTFDYERGQ